MLPCVDRVVPAGCDASRRVRLETYAIRNPIMVPAGTGRARDEHGSLATSGPSFACLVAGVTSSCARAAPHRAWATCAPALLTSQLGRGASLPPSRPCRALMWRSWFLTGPPTAPGIFDARPSAYFFNDFIIL